MLDLQIIDAQRVFAVGAYNLSCETGDGGKTWGAALDRMDNPRGQHLYAVASHGSAWLVAGEQGLLLRSTDAGRSFVRVSAPYAGSWFAVASPAEREWVIAGLRGHAFRSVDGGDTWVPLSGAPSASFVSAVSAADGSVLLANQAGQLYLTRGGSALKPLPGPALPPLTHAMPLAGGGVLALTFIGAMRLDAKIS